MKCFLFQPRFNWFDIGMYSLNVYLIHESLWIPLVIITIVGAIFSVQMERPFKKEQNNVTL